MVFTSPSPDAPTNLVGHKLKEYLILRFLGRGAMAQVYLAEQQSLRRQVALKVLKPDLSKDESYVRRFHREAQAAAALVHSNIVQIYEIGCDHGLHFIAQEYVAGKNLKEILQRQSALSATDTLAVLRQVGSALERAEQVGIVHRDIKPENILIGEDGLVKVADFGLARVLFEQAQVELTQVGMTLGSPLYMSPEQIEGKPLDSRSDVYSLGATAFHMLAGRPPFDGDTPLSLAMQKLQQEAPSLASFAPRTPAPLASIVARMLRRDRKERPTAAELQNVLADLESKASWLSDTTQSTNRRLALVQRSESAKRLAEVLRRSGTGTANSRVLKTAWSGFMAVPIVAGVVLAFATVPFDPLGRSPLKTTSDVTRLETVKAQFSYADAVDTESCWKSVIDYFGKNSREIGPADRYYIRSGQLQLACWYLAHDRPTEARELFHKLSELDDPEREFRAAGFAGLAIASVHLRDWDSARMAYRDYLSLESHFNRDGSAWYLEQELPWAEERIRSR